MTYQIYTLGCKVNEYESEVIKDLLENEGYKQSDSPDICIINTCTVTNTADSKSRKLIRKLKKNYPKALIVAIGCLIQNKPETIKELEIDIALGNKDKTKIITYIKNYQEKTSKLYDMTKPQEFEDMTLNNSDLTRAYIKIQDGCDNYCAFCIIPYVRGHVRCKSANKVIDEAKHLIAKGHKEIVLTGIHTGNYHDKDLDLSDLLNMLIKLDGLERLRISSVEITELNDKFLNVLKNSKKLVNHMHIPLQSGSDTILKSMNRKYNIAYFKNKLQQIRTIRPDINITTDVIVGFPGETETLFNETVRTIKELKLTKLHVFPYSKRDGTKAATMSNQIENKIKKQRVKTLLELSKENELKYMQKHINIETTFIAETYKDGFIYGHTDNFLYIKAKGKESNLKKVLKIKTIQIEYPYIVSNILES